MNSPANDSHSSETAAEGFRQHRFIRPGGATTVLLVRHGESEAATPGKPFPLVDGHADPALHEHGQLQAIELRNELQKRNDIAAIYVSSLRRTHQTAAPIATSLGMSPVIEPRLREVFLGEWEGGSIRERATQNNPVFVDVIEQQKWELIPGAESSAAFRGRTVAAMSDIAKRHTDETVVVVCHGGVIGELLAYACGIDGFTFSQANNASISEVVVHETGMSIRSFNERSHLMALDAHLDDPNA